MKHPILISLYIFLLSFPTAVSAQKEFGLQLQHNVQLGELNQQGMSNGWGLSTELISPSAFKSVSPLKLQIGARVDASYAGEQKTGSLSGEANELSIKNANYGMYGLLRFSYQRNANWQFYLEGLIGGRLFTSAEYEEPPQVECPKGNQRYLNKQFIPSWGGSLGAMLHLSEQFAIDIRASYLQGQEVQFVDLESIQTVKNARYDYRLGSGIASQLMLQVGVNFLWIDYDEMTPEQSRKLLP